MAAEGMPFPWRWNGGTISTNLEGIWGMSDEMTVEAIDAGGNVIGVGKATRKYPN